MLTSYFEQETEALAFSQIALTSLPSKCQRQALTDRTSHTNQTFKQFHFYHELHQTRKELEAYKKQHQLNQTIRLCSQSTTCRQIFEALDNFRQSFRLLLLRPQNKQQIDSLFCQLRRDLSELVQDGESSMQSDSSYGQSSTANKEMDNLQLMETLYEKLQQIDQLKKAQNQNKNITNSNFTGLQKSNFDLTHHEVRQSINVLQFKCSGTDQAETQTILDIYFVNVIKYYRQLYRGYLSVCNLVWKLGCKVIGSNNQKMIMYQRNSKSLLLWYSRFRMRSQKHDLFEAQQYMKKCNQKVIQLKTFVSQIDYMIASCKS